MGRAIFNSHEERVMPHRKLPSDDDALISYSLLIGLLVLIFIVSVFAFFS